MIGTTVFHYRILEKVGGLDVTMDDVLRVRRVQGVGNLNGQIGHSSSLIAPDAMRCLSVQPSRNSMAMIWNGNIPESFRKADNYRPSIWITPPKERYSLDPPMGIALGFPPP